MCVMPHETRENSSANFMAQPFAVGGSERVIKNEKQYRITKAQVRRFLDGLDELSGQQRPSNISPRLWQAQRQAAQGQMEELREQVEAYERLHLASDKSE